MKHILQIKVHRIFGTLFYTNVDTEYIIYAVNQGKNNVQLLQPSNLTSCIS